MFATASNWMFFAAWLEEVLPHPIDGWMGVDGMYGRMVKWAEATYGIAYEGLPVHCIRMNSETGAREEWTPQPVKFQPSDRRWID